MTKLISEEAIDFEKGGILTRTYSTYSNQHNFERTKDSQKRTLIQQMSLLKGNVCAPFYKLSKKYLAMTLICGTMLLTATIVIPITVVINTETSTSAPKPIREI